MINNLFFDFFYKHVNLYFLIFLCKLKIPIKSLAIPHFYGKLTSNLKDGNIRETKNVFLVLIILWISVQVLSYLSSRVFSELNPKLTGFMRMSIVKRIIEAYKNDYSDIELGRFITKTINSPYEIKSTLDSITKFFTDSLFLIISTFIYLITQNYYIGLIYLICISFVGCITMFYLAKCEDYVKDAQMTYDDTHEIIEDTVSNLLSIYSSNKTKSEIKNLEKENIKTEKKEKNLEKMNSKFKLVYSIVYIGIFIILNYFTFQLYIKNKITLPILISIVIINYSILTEFMDLYYNIRNLIQSKGEMVILEDYLNKLPLPKKSTKLKKFDSELVFKENFVNIKVKDLYYSIKDKQIINGISFEIKKKEKIGLCGNIGSGKSTIAKILTGLNGQYKGEILINNKPLKSLNIDKLREYVTYIPQHPKLFNRTLFDNITYGSKNKTIEDIYEILDKLDFKHLKDKFKEIMYQKVGKNGSKLSGGQRQIVCLLRALLKDNRIIIMDEPTSSLDNEIKKKVIKLIDEISKTKNILIITHDLDLLDNLDRIIVLDKGNIIKNTDVNNDSLNEIKKILGKK